MTENQKITIAYQNETGDISEVSATGIMASDESHIREWFETMALRGLGFLGSK